MDKRLIIMGAGGFGREVLQYAQHINAIEKRWSFIGFLDTDPEALKGKKCTAEVIASDAEYVIQPNDEFTCAIGQGNLRKKVMSAMKERGARFVNIIHPTAIIADSATLGEGIVVCPHVLVSADVTVGDGCVFNAYSSIGHDAKIGEYSIINSFCNITGGCELGNNVFMGTSSHIVPGICVGENAYICAGSTVVTKIKPNTKVFGNPAMKIDI